MRPIFLPLPAEGAVLATLANKALVGQERVTEDYVSTRQKRIADSDAFNFLPVIQIVVLLEYVSDCLGSLFQGLDRECRHCIKFLQGMNEVR